jgi:sugar/nucleoside kinase (ribokinase family)
MAKNSVVCIGQAVVDMLVMPVNREFQSRDLIIVDQIAYDVGGDAINEAITLAHLGVPVKLMSSVGIDMWGNFIIEKGTAAGVGMECVMRSNDYPTTICIVLIWEDGERNFICAEGTGRHFMMESLDLKAIERAKVLSLASLYTNHEMDEGFLVAAKAAKKANTIITADTMIPQSGCSLESQAELLALVDYIFPNYDEASGITGEKEPDRIAEVFLGYGVKNVVIKTGKAGCYIKSAAEKYTVPTYKNAKRVDTTGAGDNFAAGFIYGLTKNLPVRECAAYANAAASVSIQNFGARGAKSLREVEDMMAGGVL